MISIRNLIKEAIDDREMLSRVGRKDVCRGVRPSHVEAPSMVPQGVCGDASNNM